MNVFDTVLVSINEFLGPFIHSALEAYSKLLVSFHLI
ncbi:hypothetical protein HMPREF1287_01982 [Corynebacterium sp. KPL1986]|jgi:hypothetical protein|nr:hypothetical protein HMPREF1293_00360 [Corynebacterium sp. KPL1996]ERS45459.1 hypothetical protein HMPREF1287_01982 [Corynebacterium sp. KPL1986]ERS55061.1 hypothetical protein HMPREF1267_00372 [Corynebacterium sp. KPL1824]ERS74492.1 hypothetical protein HMPREF1295_00463 [Corynebacterium sp. KPL1998]ERS76299.1 hypothetical protein HMPREF1300_00360 [Corynebacterium sp. KPL2004]